jgi:hypothetical protein
MVAMLFAATRPSVMSLAFLLVSSMVGYAQTGDTSRISSTSNMECVERLEIPNYDVIALAARIQGSVEASVWLSSQSSVQRIDSDVRVNFDQGKKLLLQSVEAAIRKSKFRTNCTERPILLSFHFSVAGTPSDRPRTFTSFGYPNRFWIVAEPHSPQP